jgi:aconitase A
LVPGIPVLLKHPALEHIHRANLVFMGVLPLQFEPGTAAQMLKLDGSEVIDITGIEQGITPMQDVTMTITRKDGTKETVLLTLRIDTPVGVDYCQHNEILRELRAAVEWDLVMRRSPAAADDRLAGMHKMPAIFLLTTAAAH